MGRSGPSGHSGSSGRPGRPVRPARLALILVAGAAFVAGCSNGPAPKAAPKSAPTTTSTTGVPDTGAGLWSKAVPLAPHADLSVVSCGVVGLCLAASTTGQSYKMANGTVSAIGPVGSAPSPQGASYLTCTAAAFCVAVPNLNQVVQYDGTAWTAPVTIEAAMGFESVACVGTTWCVTIDGEGNSFVYDGGSWSGNVGAWGAANQISCVSPSFCVAVEGGTSVWNGSSWTQPGNNDDQGQLNSVSCASVSFCMAVDSAGYASDVERDGLQCAGSGGGRACPGRHRCVGSHRCLVPHAHLLPGRRLHRTCVRLRRHHLVQGHTHRQWACTQQRQLPFGVLLRRRGPEWRCLRVGPGHRGAELVAHQLGDGPVPERPPGVRRRGATSAALKKSPTR